MKNDEPIAAEPLLKFPAPVLINHAIPVGQDSEEHRRQGEPKTSRGVSLWKLGIHGHAGLSCSGTPGNTVVPKNSFVSRLPMRKVSATLEAIERVDGRRKYKF